MVIATDTHAFWVAGDINAWVQAADLKPGIWVRTSTGTYTQVTAAEHLTAPTNASATAQSPTTTRNM